MVIKDSINEIISQKLVKIEKIEDKSKKLKSLRSLIEKHKNSSHLIKYITVILKIINSLGELGGIININFKIEKMGILFQLKSALAVEEPDLILVTEQFEEEYSEILTILINPTKYFYHHWLIFVRKLREFNIFYEKFIEILYCLKEFKYEHIFNIISIMIDEIEDFNLIKENLTNFLNFFKYKDLPKEKGFYSKNEYHRLENVYVRERVNAFSKLITELNRSRLIDQNFTEISNIIIALVDVESFLVLYDSIKDRKLLRSSFNEVQNKIFKSIRLLENNERIDCIWLLIDSANNADFIKEFFIEILKEIDRVNDNRHNNNRINLISKLIDSIKRTDFHSVNCNEILSVLKKYDTSYKLLVFSKIYKKIESQDLRKEIITSVLNEITIIEDSDEKLEWISVLIKRFKGTHILQEFFFDITNWLLDIDLKPIEEKYGFNVDFFKRCYYELIDDIKNTELIKKNYSSIEKLVQTLLQKSSSDRLSFEFLLYTIKETSLVKEFIADILEFIKNGKYADNRIRFYAFTSIFKIIKKTELIIKYQIIIEDILLNLLGIFEIVEQIDGIKSKIVYSKEFIEIFCAIGLKKKHFHFIEELILRILSSIEEFVLVTTDRDVGGRGRGRLSFLGFFFMSCIIFKEEFGEEIFYIQPMNGNMNLKDKLIDLINNGFIEMYLIFNNNFFKKEELEVLFSKNEKSIIEHFEVGEDLYKSYLSEQDLSDLFKRNISKELIKILNDKIKEYLQYKEWNDDKDIVWIIRSLMWYLSDEEILDLFCTDLYILDYMNYDEYYLGIDDNVYVDKLNATKICKDFSLLLIRGLNIKDETVRNKAVRIIEELGERANYAIHFKKNMVYKDQIIEAISIAHNIQEDFLKEFVLTIVGDPKDCMDYFIGYYEEETEFKHYKYRDYREVITRIKKDLIAKINRTFDSNITLLDFLTKYPKINELILYLSNNVLPINFGEISTKEELIDIVDNLLESNEFKTNKFPCYERYDYSIKEIISKIPVILKSFDKLPYYMKNDIFYGLIDVCEDIELMEKFFSVFLETINNYIVFSDFVDSIRKFKLLNKYSSQIKTQLKHILTIHQSISSFNYDDFIALLKVVREMGWIEEYFFTLFEIIDKLQDRPYRDKYKAVSTLLLMAKKMGRLEEIFPVFLEMIDKPSEKEYDTFSGHLTLAKRMGWLERCFLVFLKRVYNFTTSRSKALSDLLEITIEKGWIEQIFPAFFDTLDDLPHYRKYLALYDLIKILKGTELFEQYYARIKSLSLSLVECIGELPDNRKQNAYYNLNLAIKGTDLENEPVFKKLKEN